MYDDTEDIVPGQVGFVYSNGQFHIHLLEYIFPFRLLHLVTPRSLVWLIRYRSGNNVSYQLIPPRFASFLPRLIANTRGRVSVSFNVILQSDLALVPPSLKNFIASMCIQVLLK